MHAGHRHRLVTSESFQHFARLRCVGKVIERLTERFARTEDVRLRERDCTVAALSKQVAAEERACRHVHRKATLPCMRYVRGIEPADAMMTELQLFVVSEHSR